jgi:hypothetical protein
MGSFLPSLFNTYILLALFLVKLFDLGGKTLTQDGLAVGIPNQA